MNAQSKQVKLGEIMENKKKEITYEDFVEKYCNKCWMRKCEGIGTTWSVCCPYQLQVKILH